MITLMTLFIVALVLAYLWDDLVTELSELLRDDGIRMYHE